MSMDGRIADAANGLGFLDTIGEGHVSPAPFDDFIATVDAVVVGATTLRWLLDGGHGWPHDDLPTWLVSHDPTLGERVGATRAPLSRVEGDLSAAFAAIEAAGHAHVWLAGGGAVAAQALALDRVDDVIVTIAPTVVGAGAALFDATDLPERRFRVLAAGHTGGDTVDVHWTRDRTPSLLRHAP